MAPPVVTISVQEFADLLGLKSQRIYQLIQAGMPHRKIKGVTRVVPAEGVKWYIDRQTWEFQQTRHKEDGGADEKRERGLKLRAERQMAELDLMERSKKVVNRTDFDEFVDRVFGGFAAVTLGRLQRFEKHAIRVTTAAESRKHTERLQAALMDGARAYADQLDDEAAELERVAAEDARHARSDRGKQAAINDDNEEE